MPQQQATEPTRGVSAHVTRAPLDAQTVGNAGEAVARDLIDSDEVVDLRDAVPAPVRASGPLAAPVFATACPCGCGEEELLARARQGDSRAVAELINRYRRLAAGKARNYFLLGSDHDDVVQEALIGLYQAVRDYDPAQGASFRSFADLCVTRQIVTAIKASARFKHAPLTQALSLDQPSTVPGAHGFTLGDLVPAVEQADPEQLVISSEQVRALQAHVDAVLSDLEAQVLRHHVEGKSYDEIAAMLQRHVKSVDNALQRIKKKLLAHLEARDRQAG